MHAASSREHPLDTCGRGWRGKILLRHLGQLRPARLAVLPSVEQVDLEVLELVREMAREANAITASSGESSRPAAPKRRAEGAYEPSKQDRSKLSGSDGIGVTRTILCMTDFLVSGSPQSCIPDYWP